MVQSVPERILRLKRAVRGTGTVRARQELVLRYVLIA